MIKFPDGVRKRILRDGTSWSSINAVKEDKTRSGKPKRMLYASMGSRQFTVKMRFTYDEYLIFDSWYNHECYKGLNSFAFPQIDRIGGDEKEYRFVAGSEPSYSNTSGKIIECSMTWEEA